MPTRIAASLYFWCDCRCVGPEILFVNDPLAGHYKGHDPGGLILRRIRDQSQASLLLAGAACFRRGILCHDTKVVPMERIGLFVVGVCRRGGNQALHILSDWIIAA